MQKLLRSFHNFLFQTKHFLPDYVQVLSLELALGSRYEYFNDQAFQIKTYSYTTAIFFNLIPSPTFLSGRDRNEGL